MKLYQLLLLVSIFLFCIGCKKEKTATVQLSQVVKELDSLSKEKIDLKLLSLSQEAKKDLESFEDFRNLKNLIHSLHTSNPYYIRKFADSIDLLIRTVDENLSEDLNVNTINSRLVVLTTASGLLNDLTLQKYPEPEKLLEANTQLITAYNSLMIQLNELSLAIPENIEKELLLDQESLRDSIDNPLSIKK